MDFEEPQTTNPHTEEEKFVQLLSKEIITKSAKDKPRGFLQPGTLISAFKQNGATYAAVHVDGDPFDTNTIIPSLIGEDAGPGVRVMILFDPPHGAYVVGSLNDCLGEQTITFSHPGTTTTTTSPPYQFTYDSVITEIIALSVNNVNTVNLYVYLNGLLIQTLVLCSERQTSGPLNILVNGNQDLLWVASELSSVENVSVLVRYKTLCTGIESAPPVDCSGGGTAT